jgi:hypothetical protein
MKTIWVSLPYATFGIYVEDHKVVDAAPIANWMIGKDYGSWGNLASQGYRYRETIGDFKGNTWYLFERKVKQ